MIRTNLRYHAPTSVDEACRILAASPAGAVIGGGTMLVPLMTRGERAVVDAVHLRRLGLSAIEHAGDTVEIGAGVTYTQILEAPAGTLPTLLTTMARGITGGAQIRNQGTLAGSASYANPSSDVPAVLVALETTLRVQGVAGTRSVPADEFFKGPFETALAPDEIVTRLSIPKTVAASGYAKLKLSESSWPIVTAAAVGHPIAGRTWRYRLVIGGACAVPLVVNVAAMGSDPLSLNPHTAGQIRQAVENALEDPWADELAPARYRRQVAGPVALKALTQLEKEMSA